MRRRSTNIVFIIFRLCLSLVMFVVLLAGLYTAYKHFSGLDPLKLDPQTILKNIPVLSSIKLTSLEDAQSNNSSASKYAFRFLLFADSHSDNVNLQKAISQAKRNYPDLAFIIGLGDYTDVGTVEELRDAKIELDLSGLRYFLLVGDHDLWDSRDKQNEPAANFKTVFGLTYQSFTVANYRFILLYNSDNYSGMTDEQLNWLADELRVAKQEAQDILVFVHEPFYHPSSDHVMGRVEKGLKSQAKNLIYLLKEAGVKKVFAGDVHYFSEYTETETNLSMVTVGAITIERSPQAPRFAMVYVFEDGSVKVEDVEIR